MKLDREALERLQWLQNFMLRKQISMREIAEIAMVSYGTVRSWHCRAREIPAHRIELIKQRS